MSTEEMSRAIGPRWTLNSFSEESEKNKKKRAVVESAVASAREKREAREIAERHFKSEEDRVRRKHNLDYDAWDEIKKALTKPDPYIYIGKTEELVIYPIPGGWRQLTCRRAVHDAFRAPMDRVADAKEEENKLLAQKLKAAEEKKKTQGKKAKKSTSEDTKRGACMYGERTAQLGDRLAYNKGLTEEAKRDRAIAHRKRMEKYRKELDACEAKVKASAKPTMPQKQTTMKASYILDTTKSEKDITSDIYGSTRDNTLKKAPEVETYWVAYVAKCGGAANIPWEALRKAYPIPEEDLEADEDAQDEDAPNSMDEEAPVDDGSTGGAGGAGGAAGEEDRAPAEEAQAHGLKRVRERGGRE